MTSSKVVQEVQPLEYSISNKHTSIKNKVKDFSIKLNPGRPDFNAVRSEKCVFIIYFNSSLIFFGDILKLFSSMTAGRKEKVDVFFCGNRELGQVVQKNALKHKFKFYKENF